MSTTSSSKNLSRILAHKHLARSTQVLDGIIIGVLADGVLQDQEIHMLQTWLMENEDILSVWPGNMLSSRISTVLADGKIDDDERLHLVNTLQEIRHIDFSETGAAAPENTGLPFDEHIKVELKGKKVCHTGEFLYGTRKACEQLTSNAGGIPISSVSLQMRYLVVGTNVSPHWISESYGRKIQQALDWRNQGHEVFVIPERQWLCATQ